MEKVSVLITTYNTQSFIAETLESVLAQDYPNIEIVVSDDGSEDKTASVVRDYAAKHDRIVPLYSEENRGISYNVNRALDNCRGEFIAFLSGDDLMEKEKISKQVAFLKSRLDFDLVSHDMDVFESSTGKTIYKMSDRYRMHEGGVEILFGAQWRFQQEIKNIPSSILARAPFLKAHRFDERLKYWNEWLHMTECLLSSGKKWGHLNEVLGRYRVHDKQTHLSRASKDASFEEALMVLAILDARHPEINQLVRNKRNYALFQHLVYDWHPAEKRAKFERQFYNEAGFSKWTYMRVCRRYIRSKSFFNNTAFLRRFLKRVAA